MASTPSIAAADAEWEPYALEMLASVLDGGSSARFARELVRGAQVAASANASYSAFTRLPGLFLFDGVPANGHDIQGLERAIRGQIDRLKREPVAEDELRRVPQSEDVPRHGAPSGRSSRLISK